MESSSQQVLWKDIEMGKEKRALYQNCRRVALLLGVVVLILTLGFFSIRFWSPSLGKVYDHQYKSVVDGLETDSVLEIDPARRIEIFRMGNGSEEVVEVHDFKNGITGIRFSKHQRCYIKTQTRKVPVVTAAQAEDAQLGAGETEGVGVRVEDSQVWVPAEEPIASRAFLLDSRILEICQELPIHWIYPSPLGDAELHDIEDAEEDVPDAEVKGRRSARDVQDRLAVNDYRDVGLELDNRLDENGYCCQYCRESYRYCRRYHAPLRGFNPWPYFYRGGHVVCQIVMPCNWWIARMLGRI